VPAASGDAIVTAAVSTPSIHVLIVEDEELVAVTLRRSMSRFRNGTLTAEHAATLSDGLKQLATRPFDAVLLDLTLPDSAGLATLSTVREAAPQMPIIVLTGAADEDLELRAIELGADELFRKPCADFDALWRSMRYAMERARSARALRESEQRLAELSRRLVEVQEQERRQLARELHDEIGQTLTALSLNLQQCARDNQCNPSGAAVSQALVWDLQARVRNLSLELRPSILDDFGLWATLEWQFERFAARTGIQIDFDGETSGARFAPAIETAGYRIVQEALTNVARHAAVDRVAVQARHHDGVLQLTVEDEGTGFDATAARSNTAHFGLMSMHERAALLGGVVTVKSQPGRGTRVSAELPATPVTM